MVKQIDPSLRPQMDRIQRIALIVAVIGLGLSAVGAFVTREQFFQSYLFSYLFWLGPALGSFFFLMVQYVGGGRWGLVIRRMLEAGAMTLPLMAVLFIPIVLGMGSLYEWSHAEAVAADEILQAKAPYLNTGFFIIRAVIYFVIWCGIAYLLRSWSVDQDKRKDPALADRLKAISGPGLVLLVLSLTFAATDWGMSLEPHWFSTIYGVIYLVNYSMLTLCMLTILLHLFGNKAPLSAVMNADRVHDIGKLMFAVVCLWAYVNFAQYLIQWTGNLPEEITWYLNRILGGWEYLAIALIFGLFWVPFFLLLLRQNKRQTSLLVIIALYLLVMQVINWFWLITPAFHPEQFTVSWLDLVTFVGIGGLFVALLMFNLKRQPLLPPNDERVEFAVKTAHSPGH